MLTHITHQSACYVRDKDVIMSRGLWFGYNEYVLMVIFLQAAGGLVRKQHMHLLRTDRLPFLDCGHGG
jgi:hypothetical protein